MRLKTLTIEGFKTFAKLQTFDFTEYPEDGLCFVSGDNKVDPELAGNGAGKSTIFDALTNACFGKTSRGLKAGDVASWQVAHELADQAEAAIEAGGKKLTKKATTPSVTTAVSFENYNGDLCHINRRWNPNVLTMQVGDGEPKNVDQADIDSMIGYNFDEFLQAAYFSQFQDLFLDMGSSERAALIAKVLNLDVWDKHSDAAKHDADDQKKIIEEDRKAIERLKGQIEELEAQDLAVQIANWDDEQAIDLKKLQEVLATHKKSEKKVKEAVTKADKADKRQDEIVTKLEDEQEATVQEAIKPIQDELAAIIKKSDEDLELAESLDDENYKDSERDFKTEIRDAEKKESQLSIDLSSLEKAMDKVEAKAKKVEKLEGDCSSCNQPITAEHVDHELDVCDKELAELEDQADALEVDLRKAKKVLKKLETEEAADSDAKKASTLKQKQMMTLLRNERADTERDYADRIKTKESDVRADSREALKGAQVLLTGTTATLTAAKTTLRDWKNDLDDCNSDVEDCEDEKNPHIVQQEKNTKRLSTLTTEREAAFTLLEQKVEDESASRYWVRGFKSVKLFAVSNALNELEAEVNSALDGLGLGGWSVEFDVDKENKSGTLSKGFFAFINGPDNLEPVKWEAWSGGESQRLRLAASLGLANMIRSSKGLDLPFEIWDEPSQWMSDAGITGLLDVLQRRAKRLKRQIWLIDHRGLEYPFDATICVTKTLEGSTIANVTGKLGNTV
jgi:DNA repair exonuclease SbcCD ATPase subunit